MKTWLIVFIVLFVILLIPVGVDGGYRGGALVVGLKIGPLNIKLFPRRKKPYNALKEEKKRRRAEEKAEKDDDEDEDERYLGKLYDMARLVLDTLSRFRRRLRVDYMRIRLSVGGGDPFRAAMRCAAVSAAMGTVLPLLETALDIKERDFGVDPDFMSGKIRADIWLTAGMHVIDILYLAFALGFQHLRLKLKQKKTKPKTERTEANG